MNAHMITLRTEPIAHKTIFKCIDDPDFGEEWMQALFFQYDKNAAITLTAQPAQQEEVPEGYKVYQAVISTKIKKKGTDLHQLVARMCANGSKQEKGIN
jgi:hypothetical protein